MKVQQLAIPLLMLFLCTSAKAEKYYSCVGSDSQAEMGIVLNEAETEAHNLNSTSSLGGQLAGTSGGLKEYRLKSYFWPKDFLGSLLVAIQENATRNMFWKENTYLQSIKLTCSLKGANGPGMPSWNERMAACKARGKCDWVQSGCEAHLTCDGFDCGEPKNVPNCEESGGGGDS